MHKSTSPPLLFPNECWEAHPMRFFSIQLSQQFTGLHVLLQTLFNVHKGVATYTSKLSNQECG